MHSLGGFVQEALALEGPCRDGLDRVLVERQGVRRRRAAAPPRPGRRGRRRRRRHAVRQRAVRLQRAAAGLGRAVPAVRRRAQRHQPRRGGRLRPARACRRRRRAAAASATANRATPTTCRPRIPRAWAPSARSTTRWRAPASTPPTSTYINLHGTASAKNDEVEAALVARRFPARTHASSTKGLTGHTLGAAGIVEAVASLLALETGLMPGTVNSARRSTPPAGRRSASHRRAARCASRSATRSASAAATASSSSPGRRDERRPGAGVRRVGRLLGADAARLGRRRARRCAARAACVEPPARRPAPELLAPAERRRAPDTVALALEVAAQRRARVRLRGAASCRASSPRRTATSASTTTCARRWQHSRR